MANQNALKNNPRLRFKQTKHPHARAVVSSTPTAAICADELPTEGADSNFPHHFSVITVSNNLELVGVVLVEERDRDAHNAVVVAGDRVGERHFDGVEVVVPIVLRLALDLLVFAEPQVVRRGHALQLLVAVSMVQVCVPADALDADVLDAIFVDAPTGRFQRVMGRNAELAVAAGDRRAQPQLVVLDQREDL